MRVAFCSAILASGRSGDVQLFTGLSLLVILKTHAGIALAVTKMAESYPQSSQRHRSDEPLLSSPIAFMARRARLILGQTQGEFAVHMGVDQASVSRWERSRSEPTVAHLDEIRRIVATAEPCHSHAYIAAAPTMKYMCRRDNFLKPLVISKGLAEAAGFDPDEVIRNPERYMKEGIRRLNEAVQSDARWEHGEIAFFESRFFSPILRAWVKAIGAPIAEANAALIEAAPDRNPVEEFWVKLTPFEEIGDGT